MSAIGGKNTRPEWVVRRGLHKLGFRYSLHNKRLPGKPDLVFRKYQAVIFVHGCFWHAHHCHMFRWPSTREKFWRDKINANCHRDVRQLAELNLLGWRSLVIWECALKGKHRRKIAEVIHTAANWLLYDDQNAELNSKKTRGG